MGIRTALEILILFGIILLLTLKKEILLLDELILLGLELRDHVRLLIGILKSKIKKELI